MTLAIRLAVIVFLAATPALADESGAAKGRTLYLVRHGAYHDTATTDPARTLTPLGIAQARLAAARLRGEAATYASITSSTLTRARETAQVIHTSLASVPLGENALLSECTPRTSEQRVAAGTTEEAMAACEKQLDEAFQKYFIPAMGTEKTDILVAHGNMIRYLVLKALGLPTREWLRMTVGNASLTVIQVRPDGTFRVASVGDVGHIPPELRSGSTAVTPQLVVPGR